MINPQDSMTIEDLVTWLRKESGEKHEIESGVKLYVALFLAAGIRTTACCEGHNGGLPWVLLDGSVDDDEIMALLNAAKIGDGVKIEHGEPYEGLPFDFFEKKVTFPSMHPAHLLQMSNGQREVEE